MSSSTAVSNKKFKMPTVKEFLDMKRLYDDKKDPDWLYLEKKQQKNLPDKPYNEKVGIWCKFLKELRYYKWCQAKREAKQIHRECGPPWYCEFSTYQKEILERLRDCIHSDIIEDRPSRVRKALWDLGLTLRIPTQILMDAMLESAEDPGVFLWNLYASVYKKSPSVLRNSYDINSKLLMSSLVFIDIKECVDTFDDMMYTKTVAPPPKKRKPRKKKQLEIRYGEYLQKIKVPKHKFNNPKTWKPKKIDYKFKLRSKESYERLRLSTEFLDKRKERNIKEKATERVCNYKFWEAPCSLRNTDPKMAAYISKLKMLKLKAKIKVKTETSNNQYCIGGVSYTGEKPNFVVSAITSLPTGFIHVNGGYFTKTGEMGIEYIPIIFGHWKFPKDDKDLCEVNCQCLSVWEQPVMEYVKQAKCRCGHMYDFFNEGKVMEKFMHPATRYGPMWFDEARIYQLDPQEEFIKSRVEEALRSKTISTKGSTPTIAAEDLNPTELVTVLLADLSYSPLLIPHLPKANTLNHLREWVRKRLRGPLTPEEHQKLILHSQRRWLQLSHMDFRARAYRIPFTQQHLEKMDWSQRYKLQRLFNILLEDFSTRNRMMQLEQSRMWWSTMKFDEYPSKAFLDIYYTLMPARMIDTYLLNPFNQSDVKRNTGTSCGR